MCEKAICNSRGSNVRCPANALVQLPHVFGPEQAVIDRHDYLAAGRSAVLRLKDERRRQQRPMNAGGAIVRGCAPHAVINPHRRRDIARATPARQSACGV